MSNTDLKIMDSLKSNPEHSLQVLYDNYYSFICNVVYKMVGDGTIAEDIAQEVFIEVWNRRDTLDVNTTIKGYLRRVAVNKTLNHIRARKMKFEEEDAILQVPSNEESSQLILEADDLQELITSAINKLPEKCRVVFGLSRFEELSYKEISEKLGISIKTVENQVSKALKIMRNELLEDSD